MIFPAFEIKPILKYVRIPPPAFMLIAGMIARNLFGDVMDAYPALWTTWICKYIVAILLVRGGLSVTFKGKGISIGLLVLIP